MKARLESDGRRSVSSLHPTQGRPLMLGTALDHDPSLEYLAAYFLPGRAAKDVSCWGWPRERQR
jgi:hypothetical protein